ncbi:MAG: glycoside hydrolase family 97 catalytic domain-containing protein, partial [Pirellulales bacterium]|nr:glycoside hydrolase family 97 catalytic domain-containing protein [Pirellulales bacterium]
GNFYGKVEPSSTLPWATPWRVVMVGGSLNTLVESTLINDLCPPSKVKDTSWIKPGRVAWSWWSDHDSPHDYGKQVKFVDLAAEMGWEYCLVDANWTLMNGGDVRKLAKYASDKGVGLLLWYNSGGPNNFVTEKPRGCMFDRRVRQFEFELLKKWGIKGVKIDFFQSDKQATMRQYVDILQDAIDSKILINFHGCTVPRGWSRTYPHLLSMEAVKGAECYTFGPEYPQKAPWHNTVIAFTRNLVGPVDYTPCAFSHDKYPHLTTNAYELALAVVFETGLIHFADSAETYRALPEAPKQLLRDVPAAWDDIRLIGGEPGKFIVIARRKGDQWFVAGINGENSARKIAFAPDFLENKPYRSILIGDGATQDTFSTYNGKAVKDKTIELEMKPYGGFVMRLMPDAR